MNVIKRVKEFVLVLTGSKEVGGARGKELLKLIEKEEQLKQAHEGTPVCPYCAGKMMFRHSKLAGGNGAPLRDDQAWKCPCCKHTAHFGIPVTRGEFDEMKLERGGLFLSRPSFRLGERGDAEVRKRLRDLGYLEFD